MNISGITRAGLATATLVSTSLAVGAAQAETDFSFEASAGLRYDSNISIPAADLLADDKDYSSLLKFKAGIDTDISSNTSFEVAYSFRQSLHFDRSDFDVQTHGFKAQLKHDFGAFKTGIAYRYYDTSLGSIGFLKMQSVQPYASFYATDNLYIRATYIYTDKNLVGQLDRDATRHGIGADAYFYMNRKKSYFLVGYRYDDQNAVGDEFDYSASRFKARFSTRMPMGKLKIGWLYEDRGYDSITPSIAAIRNDDRHTVTASWEVPISRGFFAELEYRYRDYSSNLASVNYTESRATVEVGVKF